jgi:conjugative transfer signal peptidase TraF
MVRRRRMVLLLLVTGCLLLAVMLARQNTPLLIWNITSSLPKGFYKIEPGYTYGDIVAFDIPENFRSLVQERGWIPLYDRLLKRVVGRVGDTICIHQTDITLNGEWFGKTSLSDSKGRPMPQLDGCHTVQAGHVWVMLKDNPLSLDSRYFGEVDEATIYGKARLIWGYQN